MRNSWLAGSVVLAGSLALGLSATASAGWALDAGASSFQYVTSKAGAVSEVNSFDRLSGEISDAGQATLVLDLGSVNTSIDIRNQRMRDIVFKVAEFPSATVSVDVSGLDLASMPVGASAMRRIDARVEMNGKNETVAANVRVTKLAAGGVLVENTGPLLLNVGTFGYAEGVDELKTIAGLPGINPFVAIDFSLVYNSR